jgi:hypothetical protein
LRSRDKSSRDNGLHVTRGAEHVGLECGSFAAEGAGCALTPRRPAVDGVAWLDFETVAYYTAGTNPFASVGTFSGNAEFQPYLRLTLANAPTGTGVLITCRATSIAVGPHYPGYYRVEGPGVAASFEDNARPTTFTFVVPAGGSGPVEIKIYTDPDRIQLWAFYDCTITQI